MFYILLIKWNFFSILLLHEQLSDILISAESKKNIQEDLHETIKRIWSARPALYFPLAL